MPAMSKKMIPCPNCGVEIEIKEHPQEKYTRIAHHDCTGLGMVRVWQENKTPEDKPVESEKAE
jgi:hypothetical protein